MIHTKYVPHLLQAEMRGFTQISLIMSLLLFFFHLLRCVDTFCLAVDLSIH